MIKNLLILTFVVLISFVRANDYFSGDIKLACELLLCLPSNTWDGGCRECQLKFHSIHGKNPSKTIAKRINFIKKCPTANNFSYSKLKEIVKQNNIENAQVHLPCDAKVYNEYFSFLLINKNYKNKVSTIVDNRKIPAKCAGKLLYVKDKYVNIENE